MMYLGCQDVVNAHGEIIGKGEVAEQAEQVMKKLQTALSAGDGTLETSEWI